jgi:uncharacterized protein (TIGR02453 family)
MNAVYSFLKQLRENNSKEWFEQNRNLYNEAKTQFEFLVEYLLPKVKNIDPSVSSMSAKECIFRIHRDVRFTKDKLPYKTNFGAYMARGGKKGPFAGYYIHIEPGGESFAGGGIYMPEPEVLFKMRSAIYENPEEFLEIISEKTFLNYFSQVQGEKLKTVPKQFPKDFEHAELLKFKSYFVMRPFSDEDILSEKFTEKIEKTFETMKPFNDFFNAAVED